jgi:hypothetical protein
MSLKDSLVSWWKLEETSGTRYDAHASNDLTDGNTVTYGTGVHGNAAEFEWTTDEHLWRNDSTTGPFAPGNADFSMVCWVYPTITIATAGDDMKMMAKANYTGGSYSHYGTMIFDDAGKENYFGAEVRGAGLGTQKVFSNTFGALSLSTWHFCYFYHDATANELGVSVNAGTVDTQSWTDGIYNGANGQFVLGFAHPSDTIEPLDGRIDEAAFWDRVLTSSEVTALYNSGDGLTYEMLDEDDDVIWMMSTNGWWDKLNGILQPKREILLPNYGF